MYEYVPPLTRRRDDCGEQERRGETDIGGGHPLETKIRKKQLLKGNGGKAAAGNRGETKPYGIPLCRIYRRAANRAFNPERCRGRVATSTDNSEQSAQLPCSCHALLKTRSDAWCAQVKHCSRVVDRSDGRQQPTHTGQDFCFRHMRKDTPSCCSRDFLCLGQIFCNEMEEDYELGEALRGDITDNPLEIYMRVRQNRKMLDVRADVGPRT